MKLKTIFFVFLLLLTTIYVPAQTALIQNGTIEVQVMLLDNVKDIELSVNQPLSTNDKVLTYKVVKVLKGFYPGSTVHIYQDSIREAIKNETIANHVTYIYKLKLTGPAQEGKPDIYQIIL